MTDDRAQDDYVVRETPDREGWAPLQSRARHTHIALEETRHSFQEADFTFYLYFKKKAVKRPNTQLTSKSQSTVRKTMRSIDSCYLNLGVDF